MLPIPRVSRRTFLKGAAAGGAALAIATVVPAGLASAQQLKPASALQAITSRIVTLNVNGKALRVEVEPRDMLVDVLRDKLNLIGTKRPCNRMECGGCTVILNGRNVMSCTVPAIRQDGAEILTVEGFAVDKVLDTVQKSYVDLDALQCAYCIPGFIMSATHLLKRNPNPTVDEIKHGLSGNLCRCGTYINQILAVQEAGRRLRGAS